MQVFFKKCSEAIGRAAALKSYGVFYSEKQDADTSMHVHECCEVLFCVSGGKTFFINDRIYDVCDGDIFVINQFETHKITSDSEKIFKRYVLQIHPAFLYSHSSASTDLSGCFYMRGDNISHKLSLSPDQREIFNALFADLSADFGHGDDIIKDLRTIEIVTWLNRCFSENNHGFKYVPSYENSVIEASITYINRNISERLSLADIAANSFVSVNQLCYLFKKHLGTTVAKYITSKRITEAKKLLNKGESVSETALSCGFYDYSNFIRTFKNVVGISPGKYHSQENEKK